MDDFIKFIKLSKEASKNIKCTSSQVNIVMGNESCDLDSMIGALGLAYFNYLKNCSSNSIIIIPLLNVNANEMDYKTENCYVLKKLNIERGSLVFRNNLNLEQLQQCVNLSVSLVDHHVLAARDAFLASSVVEIIDHRPVDKSTVWSSRVEARIEEVGSCSTLIAKKFLDSNYSISNSLAQLFYDVITFDTIGFDPKAGKVKVLDVNVANQLVEKYCLESDSAKTYGELWTAHNDISHLTSKQLLYKDLKVVNGIPIPGLPMLVEKYLQFPNVTVDIREFCREKESNTVIILGLDVLQNSEVHRDIAIYSDNIENPVAGAIKSNLKNSKQIKGYDFGLEEVPTKFSNIIYFKQNNITLSRKQITPLIKDVVKINFT